MTEKWDFSNKKKVVTFQLVHRSIDDPMNADPNASGHVLMPIHVGEDVDPALVEHLSKQMAPERGNQKEKKSKKRSLGVEYNKYFGQPEETEEDVSKFFRPIDEESDTGVFIAPDGSTYDLSKREVEDVDILLHKMGLSSELFGTENIADAPKLVDDTNNLLGNVDPDIFLAMDDENAEPLDDDFFSKALDMENGDYDDGFEEEDMGFDMDDNQSIAKSRVSFAPTHASHISHRSEAMDYVEQKVDYLVDNVYKNLGEEEDYDEEEEDSEVDWGAIANDMKKFNHGITIHDNEPKKPVHQPIKHQASTEPSLMIDEEDDTPILFDDKPKEIPADIRSVTDCTSTTENLPGRIFDKSNKKARKDKPKEEEPKLPDQPDFVGSEGESKEERKKRKKEIKEYQRQKRQMKKEIGSKFAEAKTKVKKSIAASGGLRGQTIYNLD